MHSTVEVSVSSNAMDAQVHGERLVRCGWCGATGAARLVRPNQLLPTVLLVLWTAGVRREVGTNNHHNSFPPPRWV